MRPHGLNGRIGERHLPSQDKTNPSTRSDIEVCSQQMGPIGSLKLNFSAAC
jgi:hypothetical protein